jgi:membrane fusion protein, multidrug efflux system
MGSVLAGLSLVAIAAGAARAQSAGPDPMRGDPDIIPELRVQVTPRDYTTLSSETAARIDKINTRVGEHFKKGDVLVVFDCVIQQAQLARARAVLTQAEKTLAVDHRLVQLKSMGELELAVAAAEVAKAKADLAGADALVSKCSIAAPFTGVTVDQKAREFQYTTPGQALLDVLDDRSLELELIVPSRGLGWLKPGYPFEVHVEETDKNYPAKVTRLGGRVDPVSQSIKVFGEITGPAPDLIAGMSGRANIPPPK